MTSQLRRVIFVLISVLTISSTKATCENHNAYRSLNTLIKSQNTNSNDESVAFHGLRIRRQAIGTLGEEDLIPDGYLPDFSPTPGAADKVQVAFVIINVRDFNEKDQDFTLEVNFRMYWQDDRLKKIEIPEGSSYVSISTKLLSKLWIPDIIIDGVKEVSQPALLSKPSSLRIYADNKLRYSARMTIKMACNMDFQFYPADTQRCTISLRSMEYSNANLMWYGAKTEAVKIAKEFTVSSSYDVTVSDILNVNRTILAKREKFFSIVRFDILFQRHLHYHMIQTFFPSIIFVITSWLSFLVTPETVSARMTLCMSTLLTLTTMFAVVRQNTPNESYAKALDVWMLACIFFVFFTLVEYAVLLKLNSINRDAKKNDGDDLGQSSKLRGYWKMINWRSWDRGISRRRPHTENDSNSTRKNEEGTGDECSEFRVAKDPEKYKKMAVTIERISSFAIPSLFVLFNVVFWPVLLLQSHDLKV